LQTNFGQLRLILIKCTIQEGSFWQVQDAYQSLIARAFLPEGIYVGTCADHPKKWGIVSDLNIRSKEIIIRAIDAGFEADALINCAGWTYMWVRRSIDIGRIIIKAIYK
jgi:hypothetical protein